MSIKYKDLSPSGHQAYLLLLQMRRAIEDFKDASFKEEDLKIYEEEYRHCKVRLLSSLYMNKHRLKEKEFQFFNNEYQNEELRFEQIK